MTTITYPDTTRLTTTCLSGCTNAHCRGKKKLFRNQNDVPDNLCKDAQAEQEEATSLWRENSGTSNDPYIK